MTDPGIVIPPHRPTILVGYGAFGLEVLRRLLASTAPRGVLTWEEARGGAAATDRHLRDLALLWFPDPMASVAETLDHENAREGGALEMMRDLYRQIERIGPEDRAPTENDFADALSEAADMLLSAVARATRKDALPLGLDVFVIARPATREVLGALDLLLIKGMDRLANNTNLERGVQGAEALNFLAFFDFEHYWDREKKGHDVRRALRDSIEQSERRRVAGKAAFSRFYLVDGRTDDGTREPFHRVDEISLFIEFLLFEGQRGGDLPRLYRPTGNESPIATFGIRLVERSAGLLSHLAAARFGIEWLEYLAGEGPFRNDVEPAHLRARLDPYTPEALETLLDADSLRAEVEKRLDTLEQELAALPVALPDWPERVRRRYDETRHELHAALARRAQERMAWIAENHLRQLPAELHQGVEKDLRDEKKPVPLGSVLAELKALLQRLEPPEVTPPEPGRAEEHLRGIERLHADYTRFEQERVSVEGLKGWWPLLAIALSASLTPIVQQVLGAIAPPDSMSFLLSRAYAALFWINQPLLLGFLLFFLTWGLGRALLQPGIAGRVERTSRFFDDSDRGRFVDRLRGGLKSGGALREPVDDQVNRLILDMALSVRGEVTREVGRVVARLEERQREMRWLSGQLRGFLQLNGLNNDESRLDSERLERDGTGIRFAMEHADDLDAMMRLNPAVPDRFRSVQASHSPFVSWEDRYSRSFLVPIEFLDRLSKLYRDPIENELARAGSGPEQRRIASKLLDFIRQRGALSLAFLIKPQEGLPPDQRYCLLPPLWQQLDGVRTALGGLRMGEQAILNGANEGRGYLLRFLGGIDPKCLLEQP